MADYHWLTIIEGFYQKDYEMENLKYHRSASNKLVPNQQDYGNGGLTAIRGISRTYCGISHKCQSTTFTSSVLV